MKTLVWAHRGASGYAPENTLEAFELAIKMGADGVELDVQLTKDGELVVIHDETIDRVSDGTGLVSDYTLEELQKFNANKMQPQYTEKEVHIPTLKEVYELLKPSDLTINVELKTGIFSYPGIEEKVLKLSKEMGMEERIWYSSFNHYSLKKIKECSPASKCGILYADGIYKAADYAKELGVEALHPALYNVRFPEIVKEYKEKGLRMHVWTVNEEKYIKMMIEAGVEAVITNYPDVAKKLIEK